MVFEASGGLAPAVLFLVGVVIVVVSVETFIEAVAEAALALGASGFFLTVVLAGTDLENVVLGLTAAVRELPGLALGTVFGEALFVLAAAVGLAGVVVPFETNVPRSYLGLMILSPLLFLALALDGTLSRLDGAILTAIFLPYLAVVYALERRTETQYLSAEEIALQEDETGTEVDDRRGAEADDGRGTEADNGTGTRGSDREEDGGWSNLDIDLDLDIDDLVAERVPERYRGVAYLAVAVVAAIGMTVGSELAVSGAGDLLELLGVTGLTFGATVLSFVASLEELFLTVEPVRRGRPHIGVGNVVGSVLFFVSANAGLIAMVRPLDTTGTVLTVHWPFFLLTLSIVAVAFLRGRVDRPTGVLLLGVYLAYWLANYAV
ncbi:sodium:calcium antiporter [Natronomonas sp.]|jgi:cation:H+ antiporter|uniref:sodium:calcium antiporter n=1 Tax=Natronomonas sp. TaxID=2184060 RepID=UPI003989E93E